MIAQLRIKNYALIRELDIELKGGFTSITGETGAGKSILLGAIGLIMGDRSDSSAILDASKKCIIEAEFNIETLSLQSEFDARDLDYSAHCLIRREWLPNGKTRSFINESQVTVSDLKWLGSKLLEIHSQHTGLLVTQSEEQIKLLDTFCNASPVLNAYRESFHQHNLLIKKLTDSKERFSKLQLESDYHNYLLTELNEFNLNVKSDADLENEIALLSQSESLEIALSKIEFLLNSTENSVLDKLNEIKNELKPFALLSNDLTEYLDRISAITIETKELSRDFGNASANFESNPAKLEELNKRYNQLQLLYRKHAVSNVSELEKKHEELSQTQAIESHLEEEIQRLQIEVNQAKVQMQTRSKTLSELRKSKAPSLSSAVIEQLKQLEMPFAQIQIRVESMGEQFNDYGNDKIFIDFSANKGQSPMPIEKVASGGEISRLNFCLRTIIAELRQLPTLIYDEADTGVSGEVASRLGYLMQQQGKKQQILAITHLPQVAAQGNQQLFVYKDNEASISETRIKSLTEEGRISAIAEMLSGKNPSAAAMLNAKTLLTSAQS